MTIFKRIKSIFLNNILLGSFIIVFFMSFLVVVLVKNYRNNECQFLIRECYLESSRYLEKCLRETYLLSICKSHPDKIEYDLEKKEKEQETASKAIEDYYSKTEEELENMTVEQKLFEGLGLEYKEK